MRGLRRKAALRILLLGIFLTTVGDALASIAFTLQAAKSNRPDILALVLLSDLIPGIIFGLLGGVLADKKLRWWWWSCVLFVQAVLYAAMAFSLQWHVIFVGIAVVSGLNALIGPVSKKLVAHYSDNTHRVGAQLALISGTAQAIGLLLGGLSMGFGAIKYLLLGTTVALGAFALMSLWVAVPQAIHIDRTPQNRTFKGFQILASAQLFGFAGLILLIGVILSTSFEGVVNVFVLTGPAKFSTVEFAIASAVWALSLMIGSLIAPRLKLAGYSGLACAGLGIGLPIVLVGIFLPSLEIVFFLYALGGFSNGLFNALINGAILGVSARLQGRSWAAFHWIVNMCFLMGYTAGGFFGAIYARELMILAGGGVILFIFLCSLFRRVLKRKHISPR